MSVHCNLDNITKDGRKWYFTCYYKDLNGNTKQYKSKKFLTRKEAELEELTFKTKNESPNYIKFEVVANDYFSELETKRKYSTIYSYKKDYKNHIMPYFAQKYINSINIPEIRKWREIILKKV